MKAMLHSKDVELTYQFSSCVKYFREGLRVDYKEIVVMSGIVQYVYLALRPFNLKSLVSNFQQFLQRKEKRKMSKKK